MSDLTPIDTATATPAFRRGECARLAAFCEAEIARRRDKASILDMVQDARCHVLADIQHLAMTGGDHTELQALIDEFDDSALYRATIGEK